MGSAMDGMLGVGNDGNPGFTMLGSFNPGSGDESVMDI